MAHSEFNSWQAVQDEVLRRINARLWAPGDQLPTETELAAEFGCARTTMNRALRSLAERGVLDRKRKAGTRVALQPDAKATLTISLIRKDIEARGQVYTYQRLLRETGPAPANIRAAMQLGDQPMLHLQALHLADGAPHVFEDRWINAAAAPGVLDKAFTTISANEWLLKHAPYTHGDITFSARAAEASIATPLACAPGAALFVIDRLTWNGAEAVTKVRLSFAPGHQMRTQL